MTCDTETCKAECCGATPIPRETYAKYRHLIQRDCVEYPTPDPEMVVVCDPDLVCGFLGDDRRCMIYNFRPEICRLFGETGQIHPFLHCPFLERTA